MKLKLKFIAPGALAATALGTAFVVPSTMADQQPDTVAATSSSEHADNEAVQEETTDPAQESRGTVSSHTIELEETRTPTRLDVSELKIPEPPAPEPEPETTTPQPETAPQPQQQTFEAPAVADYAGDVVTAALSRVGTPYVWGGSTPAGFDCSGLMVWSYAQAGVSLPRTSHAQIAGGTPVSLDALQPGDIIGSYGGGHVGMYVGDGQVVHAPQSGDVVKVVPLSGFSAETATRY